VSAVVTLAPVFTVLGVQPRMGVPTGTSGSADRLEPARRCLVVGGSMATALGARSKTA